LAMAAAAVHAEKAKDAAIILDMVRRYVDDSLFFKEQGKNGTS